MNDDWTEKLIDAHLEAPNAAEPSVGFESRLLSHVAERKATRHPMSWLVWASAAVAAVILAIVFFPRPVPKPLPVATATVVVPEESQRVASPKVTAEAAVVKRLIAPKPRHEAVPTAVTVRQDVFPAPAPLSEQERLAFAYLRGTPRSEVIAMSRPEPELPQEINQVIPGPEVNRTLPSSTR